MSLAFQMSDLLRFFWQLKDISHPIWAILFVETNENAKFWIRFWRKGDGRGFYQNFQYQPSSSFWIRIEFCEGLLGSEADLWENIESSEDDREKEVN